MPEAHSKYSASRFEADMLCPGRRVLERGQPNRSSVYADEGTAAHEVLSMALTEDRPAAAYLGREIRVSKTDPNDTIAVTDDMVAAVQVAIDNIRDIVGDGMLLSEQRVCYASYIGVPDDEGWGTSDIIAARGDELQVHDYKHGQGVRVDAEDNEQMKLYGLGALVAVNDLLGPFKTVRLVIHQPRIHHAPSEWTIAVEELESWGRSTARSAVATMRNAETATREELEAVFLRPGEKQCKFCRAKALCPRLRNEVATTVFVAKPAAPDEFEALPATVVQHVKPADSAWLSAALGKVDVIEDWCKAIRAEVERRLLAGDTVPGFKLVQGKQGNRAWKSAAEAEAVLKAMRLKQDQMYDFSLISPTSAEKLAPKFDKDGRVKPGQDATPIGERQWKKLQTLIVRPPGKTHVAPLSDERPAIEVKPVADEFPPTPETADLA